MPDVSILKKKKKAMELNLTKKKKRLYTRIHKKYKQKIHQYRKNTSISSRNIFIIHPTNIHRNTPTKLETPCNNSLINICVNYPICLRVFEATPKVALPEGNVTNESENKSVLFFSVCPKGPSMFIPVGSPLCAPSKRR